jgi:4-hydroxybenzoyl-CoA thioesterase
MSEHVYRTTVRFGDCDPAGILYYPRYFDLFHQAMESWFDGPLGLPYHEVIGLRRVGFPSVKAQATYRAPVRFGEAVDVHLAVRERGRSSMTLAFSLWGAEDGRIRAEGEVVVVVIDMDLTSDRYMRAIACPPDIAERIDRFLEVS